MTDALEEIFKSDQAPLELIRKSMSVWSSKLSSTEAEIKDFTEFVVRNIKAKTFTRIPRKAFLIFSVASEDSCKATFAMKPTYLEGYLTYLIKVIGRGVALYGETVANILEEDTEQCIKVSFYMPHIW